jgi:hypothetical protein
MTRLEEQQTTAQNTITQAVQQAAGYTGKTFLSEGEREDILSRMVVKHEGTANGHNLFSVKVDGRLTAGYIFEEDGQAIVDDVGNFDLPEALAAVKKEAIKADPVGLFFYPITDPCITPNFLIGHNGFLLTNGTVQDKQELADAVDKVSLESLTSWTAEQINKG